MRNEVQRLNEFTRAAPEAIRQNAPLIDFLTDKGFFRAPECRKGTEGGLYEESAAACSIIRRMTDGLGLEWQRPDSPFIVGMFHALWKIDRWAEIIDEHGVAFFGEEDLKGRKSHYEKAAGIIGGKGGKSVMLLSRFFTLTEEEIYCLRYYADPPAFALRAYPNIAYLHAAALLAGKGRDK